MFPLWQGKWTGKDLTCVTRHGLVRVSLEQKRASLEPVPADQQRLWKAISAYQPEDSSWFAYQVVLFREGPLAVLCEARSEGATLRFRIRLVDTRDDRRRVLFEEHHRIASWIVLDPVHRMASSFSSPSSRKAKDDSRGPP